MPIMQARKRGTVEAYQLNLDDALNLMIQPFDVTRAVNEGMAYMASDYDAIAGGGATNMTITTGPNDAWGMKVRVVTGGWAEVHLFEGTNVPAPFPTVIDVRALNRPAPFVAEGALGGRLDVIARQLVFAGTTQLCVAITGGMEGVVLGGSSADDPLMWILNPSSRYGIEVTDLTLIANAVNITATFYLLNLP